MYVCMFAKIPNSFFIRYAKLYIHLHVQLQKSKAYSWKYV